MLAWTWAAAVSRGTSHEKSDTPAEDSQSCFVCRPGGLGFFVGIVSDGAGSAEFGRQGAALVCRSISTEIRRYFENTSTMPSESTVAAWIDSTRDRIFAVSERKLLAPRVFASTLVCVIASRREALVIHIGDGCVVLKDENIGEWIAPTWPDHGEYASTTSFVIDDPAPRLRVNHLTGNFGAVVLFSDGLERLALDFKNRQPFPRFFEGVSTPIHQSVEVGRDRKLSAQLRNFLNSEAVNSRTDDDKTLIIAVPR